MDRGNLDSAILGRRCGEAVVKRAFTRGDMFVLAGGALAGVETFAAPAKAAQYQFKCAAGQPADHPAVVRAKQMFAAIERESGGRIHTDIFPNGILGSDAALIPQLRLGAIQFWIGLAYLPIVMRRRSRSRRSASQLPR